MPRWVVVESMCDMRQYKSGVYKLVGEGADYWEEELTAAKVVPIMEAAGVKAKAT